MDILEVVFFFKLEACCYLRGNFTPPIKTEAGSAGEQPARDYIGDRQKCLSMGRA
jgi:hypothetical protein